MIPILFAGNETEFTTNGIGRLSDAKSCVVTENRNGAYTLEMEYPIDGIHYSDIALGNYLFCKPSKSANNQAFEVYEISKPINGMVTIYAQHISWRLNKTPCMPFSAGDVVSAMAGLKTNAVEACPFTFWTNKSTVAGYNQRTPASIRERLGGVEGSILDTYGGGDYEFDMFTVKLWDRRGADNGVELRYGKNLTDLKQEESIEDTITGIVPYFANEETVVTLPERAIETESAGSFPYPRTVPVDLTSEFENTTPTVEQLRTAGNAYITKHGVGVPKVSLSVSFVNLADTEEYKDVAVLENVNLCDTVTVKFEKLGVNATARVVKTVYDILTERYTSLEIGDARSNLSTRIAEQGRTIDKNIKDMGSVMQQAISHATSLITGNLGGHVVFHTNDQGKPYEILIMDTDNINTARNVWRWNQAGWGHSSTGYNGPYTLAATLDGGIVADYITSGKITGIEFNNGNGKFRVDAQGNLTASNASISGSISGSSISGGTISGASISGGTISGGSISGGTVDGTTITGSTFKNSNNTFSIDSSGNIEGATIKGGTVTSGNEYGYNLYLFNNNIYGRVGSSSFANISCGTYPSMDPDRPGNRLGMKLSSDYDIQMVCNGFGIDSGDRLAVVEGSGLWAECDGDIFLVAKGSSNLVHIESEDHNVNIRAYRNVQLRGDKNVNITGKDEIALMSPDIYVNNESGDDGYGYTGTAIINIRDNGDGSITWWSRSVINGLIIQ